MRRVAWVILALALAGCAPPDDSAPVVLETEEIGPGPDDELDLSTDRKAAPRRSSGGQLPGGFPEGLPVYKPSSITDLGEVEEGSFIQFATQDGVDRVESWYRSALQRAGWSVEAAAGAMIAARAGRKVRIVVEKSGPVSLIRIDY